MHFLFVSGSLKPLEASAILLTDTQEEKGIVGELQQPQKPDYSRATII